MVLVVSPVGSLAPVAPASGSDRAAGHLLHPVRGRRAGAGQPPRHRRHRRRHRASARRPGKREYAGRSYERARWTAPWQMSAFAFTELVASWSATHARRQLCSRSRCAAATARASRRAGTCWAAGPPATSTSAAPPSRRSPTTSPRSTSTPGRSRGSGGLVSWQLRLSLYRKAGIHGPDASRSVGVMTSRLPRVTSVAVSDPRPAGRHRARRAGVLADGALRPLPAVGRRRRGVVLADLDLDGARLLRRAAAAVGLPLRARRPPRSLGRLRRPQDLRRGLRGHRQLAVQHRVRRPARRRRVRHPAAVAARGRGRSSRPASRSSPRSPGARAS